jgi:hypothetical protein
MKQNTTKQKIPVRLIILAVLVVFAFKSSAQDMNSTNQPTNAVTSKETGEPSGNGNEESSEGEKTRALAEAAQNPVAKLISVPFQNNFNGVIGPNDVVQYDLNIEPVIPIGLSDDWNLITRTIIPIINQPSPAPGVPSAFGLGDINPQFYLSPAKANKDFIWGIGPMFTLPTATDSILGSGKYSAGPCAVALSMQGHFVFGALVNQEWSFAGWGDRRISSFLLEPFVNYNFSHGWYLVSAPIMTADWTADSNDRWTVPLGGGVGKIQRFGKLPLNLQLQAFGNVIRPSIGPEWQLRLQIQFLFPK